MSPISAATRRAGDLTGVRLSVARGELVAIMGPSGQAKRRSSAIAGLDGFGRAALRSTVPPPA
jgi:predicted ABC-type transport system involved in lysophospholipase L1 biosynthesis ATPase subunit